MCDIILVKSFFNPLFMEGRSPYHSLLSTKVYLERTPSRGVANPLKNYVCLLTEIVNLSAGIKENQL